MSDDPTWEDYLRRTMPPLNSFTLNYMSSAAPFNPPDWGIDDGDTNDHEESSREGEQG